MSVRASLDPSARLVARWRALCAAGLVLAAAGCECGGRDIKGLAPSIQVDPQSVQVDGVPGRYTEVLLKVSNVGNATLHFEKAPAFVESDDDNHAEFAVVSQFERSCDEKQRAPAEKSDIAQGDCALLVFRYLPFDNGADKAVLRLETNDPDRPTLDVPINGGAETPVVEVCASDGQTDLGCSVPGQVFEVDFGLAQAGQPVTRTLHVKSKGSRAAVLSGYNLGGDGDFTVTPDNLVKTLEPNASVDLTAVFDALAGGPREAELVLSTNDPHNERLTIHLDAVGDGPKLCFCVGANGEPCRPVPSADFGQTPIGGTSEKYLRLASCGTKPVILKQVQMTDGAPVFSAQPPNLGAGRTMAPGDPYIDVPVRFSPPSADKFTGRLSIVSSAESGFVSLQGEGIESGCKLESASTVIDFGQVGKLTEARRDYTVANRGTQPCYLAGAPTITAGAQVKFDIAGFPATTEVQPGDVVKFVVSYTPQDENGPDTGELSVHYSPAATGSPALDLKVQLKGTPTASPKCVLTANPGGNSTFGRTLNFGQVRVNTQKVMPVTFQNVGSAPCSVTRAQITASIGFDAGAFKVVGPTSFPLAIAPGQSATVDVGFTPVSDVDYGGNLPTGPGLPMPSMGVILSVNTSDTASFNGQACSSGGFIPGGGAPGCVAWSLNGRGAKSDLQVLPPDVDFGVITLGCRSREQTVTLYNTGSIPIDITEIKVDPQPPPEIFKVVAPQVPFTLAGGAQKAISVRYKPPDAQIHTGTIYFKSNATNVSGANPYVTVSLKGTGTTNSHQTDTFDQNSRPKTDVLFVVDDSGSMDQEHNELANNASRFLQVASQMNTDFQVGVVTTDMDASSRSGKLVGNPKIVVPGSGAAGQLANTVRSLGTNGSSTERGMAAMVAALTDPLINDPANNKGFLRPDAKLAVIIVSDEDDQSSGTVDFYTDFLKNIKGLANSQLVSLSAIVGDPAPNKNSGGSYGCTSNNGDAVSGDRYLTVQQRTGGKFRSICSADWGQIAADLGLDAFGARAGFPLSRQADPNTIHVTVNGQPVSQPAWSYDATANAIVFAPTSPPPAGAKIVIDYEALCL